MTDDHELEGLDPYDLLDGEAARLDAFFSTCSDEVWARPSRCAGWAVRDVLAHLAATEAYHQACLAGTVAAVFEEMAGRGATDLAAANAIGVADRASRAPADVLAEWRAADAETRAGFRARGDAPIDSSVGEYPGRWQAFHVAAELATHADDVGVPVADEERAPRTAWRARVARFALGEVHPELSIRAAGGRTVVGDGTTEVEVDDADLVEAVASRLDDASPLAAEARALLALTP
jgi:uncharacterized protein (TIGR03083 family)